MSYSRSRSNRSSFASRGASPSSPVGRVDSYSSGLSSIRRHEYSSAILGSGTIATGLYQFVPLAKFKRAFGATDDSPPTPTSGFNFQTPDTFNGSRIENFQAVIHLNNALTSTGYLTVYESALSFWDGFIWNSVFPSQCPITFDSTTVGPPDVRGEIAYKTPTATLITSNLNKSNKFLQRYIKQVGQIFMPSRESMESSVDLKISRIPAKCRRSQNGMNYTIYLHNDSVVNKSAAMQVDSSVENSFDEVPSDLRLPYIY